VKRLYAIFAVLGCVWGTGQAIANPVVLVTKPGIGAKYFARDPYVCTSKDYPKAGAITADMAAQYVTCANEYVDVHSDMLYLTSNMRAEVDLPLTADQARAFFLLNDVTDADANSPVYPIRGGFEWHQCMIPDGTKPDSFGVPPAYPPGRNCKIGHEVNANGNCYRTSFGDWSCQMMDSNVRYVGHQPGPGFRAVAATAPASQAPGTTDWSKATSKLPPVAENAPAPQAPAAKPDPQVGDVLAGMQMFEGGDFSAAYQNFHAARLQNLNDPLATLWEGVALEAMGRDSRFDLLAGNNNPIYSVASNELMALADWRRGDLPNAKVTLDACIRFNPSDTSCAGMKQGVESGASAPPVKDWPQIAGLTKITQARATVWNPLQQ
jgi:hypothetical protein